MSRTRVRRLMVTALGCAALLTTLGGLVRAREATSTTRRDPSGVPAPARSYVVRPGDTVWRIAARVVGGAEDPRPVVGAIIAANGLDPAALTPGQVLLIPEA